MQFGGFVASGFSGCTAVVLGARSQFEAAYLETGCEELGWAIEVYSTLLQHPTVLDPEEFVQLSRNKSYSWLRDCFLEVVVSADNPFVPGMTLSAALTKAASRAPEGERKKLNRLQQKIDDLLLEVLKRLPQTVRAFHGGMAGCCHVFEPECCASSATSRGDGSQRQGFLGPLWLALQERELVEIFCTRPLLMDYLSRRFTHGLPDMMDTRNVLRDQGELENLATGGRAQNCCDDGGRSGRNRDELMHYHKSSDELERKPEEDDARQSQSCCLLLDFQDKISKSATLLGKGKIFDTILSPCILLQGANYRCIGLPGLTISRGTQFIAAGLVAVPDQYYKVPVMRMILDLVVYLVMLGVFSANVLCYSDGPFTTGEKVFSFYVLVGPRSNASCFSTAFVLNDERCCVRRRRLCGCCSLQYIFFDICLQNREVVASGIAP